MVNSHFCKAYSRLSWLAFILALFVILASAFTRLTDAGLGCSDWPGCYGQLIAPSSTQNITKAEQAFAHHTVETVKAWIEMGYRYIASALSIIVLVLGIWGLYYRRSLQLSAPLLIFMMAVIVFQALLGMWTMTLKLMPLVVCTHLLGGFVVISLLWWIILKTRHYFTASSHDPGLQGLRVFAFLSLLVIIAQILLGGWTSANYVATACNSLPFCHSSGQQAWDFAQAFQLWTPFQYLSDVAQQTIQMSHRIVAVLVALIVGGLALRLILRGQTAPIKRLGYVVLGLLIVQVCLGLLNIVLHLPLSIAVLHNGFAVLLLLAIVTVNYVAYLRA